MIKQIIDKPTTIQRTKQAKEGSTDSPIVEINESKAFEFPLAKMYQEEAVGSSMSVPISDLDIVP